VESAQMTMTHAIIVTRKALRKMRTWTALLLAAIVLITPYTRVIASVGTQSGTERVGNRVH